MRLLRCARNDVLRGKLVLCRRSRGMVINHTRGLIKKLVQLLQLASHIICLVDWIRTSDSPDIYVGMRLSLK